jgi:hypothetical protein
MGAQHNRVRGNAYRIEKESRETGIPDVSKAKL